MSDAGRSADRWPSDSLDGQVAVVTGGTVGIGRDIACALARCGASVVVVSRTPAKVAETAAWISDRAGHERVLGLPLDVADADHMQAMADRALDTFGRIDVLIAAAGVLRARQGEVTTLARMDAADWDTVLNINLRGTFLSNRAVLPAMMAQGSGQIINISSTSGRKGHAYDGAYCASKFGVIGMTEALAEEMRHYGIRVQVLLPGAIETPIWNQNGPIPPPQDVLPLARVTQWLLELVHLPAAAQCLATVIEPQRRHGAPAWRSGNSTVHEQ